MVRCAYAEAACGCTLACMSESPTMDECLAELPNVAHSASEAVLDLYEAIRQARRLGATYDQLVSCTGLARGTVQNVLAGKLPRFAPD